MHTVIDVLFILGMLFAATFLEVLTGVHTNDTMLAIATFSIIILGAITEFCATVRRFHDLGYSGAYMLLSFVPLINIVVALCLLFKKGEPGTNEYGRSPR